MHASPLRRHRRWPIFVPALVVVVLAVAWSAFWFQAASRAEATIAGWREREAKAGRVYNCGSQTIGGFPFRIEVRCAQASAEWRGIAQPLSLKLGDVLVASQVYQPTLLISEFSGPLDIGESGKQPALIVNWKLGQASVRGLPSAPERTSVVLDDPRVERIAGAVQEQIGGARRMELHGRLADGSVDDRPVIEIALRLVSALAPTLHPLAGLPTDADVQVRLRGLKDFAPKPWPDRFRELQARDGRLEIVRARVQQGDVIAVGAGTLGLTPRGDLDGEMQLTVAGIDKLLRRLRFDQPVAQQQGQAGQLGAALSALDRLAPGLANLAREQAGPMIAAGLNALGTATTLENQPAVSLPLTFRNGVVSLGPLPVGRTQPLF